MPIIIPIASNATGTRSGPAPLGGALGLLVLPDFFGAEGSVKSWYLGDMMRVSRVHWRTPVLGQRSGPQANQISQTLKFAP